MKRLPGGSWRMAVALWPRIQEPLPRKSSRPLSRWQKPRGFRPSGNGQSMRGFMALLHTWSQTLIDHPHLHCLVPGGGLSLDGKRWVSSREDFFIVDLLQNLRLKPDSDKPKPGKLEYADIPITTKAGSRFCHPHPRPLSSKERGERVIYLLLL